MFAVVPGKSLAEVVEMASRPSTRSVVWIAVGVLLAILVIIVIALAADGAGGGPAR